MRRATRCTGCNCFCCGKEFSTKRDQQDREEVEEQLQADVDRALEAAPPQPETIYDFVYSPNLDPTSAVFETQAAAAVPEATADGKSSAAPSNAPAKSVNKTMADLITTTLRDEMRRDERIVIFGEDVADCSREEYLKQKLVKARAEFLS